MNKNIYCKSKTELDQEFDRLESEGKEPYVCPYYMLDRDGNKVDTWDMSTMEVAKFCVQSGRIDLQSCLKDDQLIHDYSTMHSLFQTFAGAENLSDVAKMLDAESLLREAHTIAKYMTEVEGVDTTTLDIIARKARIEKQSHSEKSIC